MRELDLTNRPGWPSVLDCCSLPARIEGMVRESGRSAESCCADRCARRGEKDGSTKDSGSAGPRACTAPGDAPPDAGSSAGTLLGRPARSLGLRGGQRVGREGDPARLPGAGSRGIPCPKTLDRRGATHSPALAAAGVARRCDRAPESGAPRPIRRALDPRIMAAEQTVVRMVSLTVPALPGDRVES
jgi:hypothetical protein